MRAHYVVLASFLLATSVATTRPAAALEITFDFDDGTDQGWVNVLTSPTDPPFGYGPSDRVDAAAPAQSGTYRVIPSTGGIFSPTEDSHHDTLVYRSPEFVLGSAASVSFYLSIGMGAAASPGADFASLPASSSTSGFEGVALRRVSDGAYLLTTRRSANDFNWELLGFDNATLASNSLLGIPLTLDLIDYFQGGFGWIAMDTVTISDVVVPEPSTSLLMLLGLTALGLSRRRRA